MLSTTGSTRYSGNSVQPVHSVNSIRSFLLLAAIAVFEGGFFDVDFTSYINPPTPVLVTLKIPTMFNKQRKRVQKVARLY